MPKMMTIAKAAKAVGITDFCLRRWIRSGKFKGYIMSGTKYLVNVDLLNDFLMGGTRE